MATDAEQPEAEALVGTERDSRRCMPVQPPGCLPRRPRRYNPDNPPPPRPPRPDKAKKNTVVLKPGVVNERREDKPPSVPVFGVQLVGGGETTLEDMAAMLIERAKQKKAAEEQRPSWDSSWKFDTSEAEQEVGGFLTDVAGVTVCGVQPIGRQSGSKLEDSSSSFSVVNCASIRDVVANAEPLPSLKSDEERGSILRRLLNLNSEKQDTTGLIRRFEPSGGKLFVMDKDRAMSKAWLGANRLLGGRAVRCLHQVTGEEYPPMRAIWYEVNDALYEPILGYASPSYGSSLDAADARRQEVKGVLDFIHEGITGGEAVVVHCRLGTNRSAVVAAAYLMIYQRVTCEEALRLMEARGPSSMVVRQPAFTEQLLRLEREILLRSREVAVGHWRDLYQEWTDPALGLDQQEGEDGGDGGGIGLPAASDFMQRKFESQQHITQAVADAAGVPSAAEARTAAEKGARGGGGGGGGYGQVSSAANGDVEGLQWGETRGEEGEVWAGAMVGGAEKEKEAEKECVSGMVEVLEGQIWHAKVLSLERRAHGSYLLCVSPPPHEDSERSGLDQCLRLRGAVVEAVGDKEMVVRSGLQSVRVLLETEEERERFLEAAVDMSERAWREGREGVDDAVLAELDETGEDGTVAHRVHVVVGDDDEEDEVWI